MDYFELFGLPVSLKVDKTYNLKKYYQLSKEFHPDNFTLSNENAQNESLNISSKINEAKKVLDNESKRLEYILQQKGIIQIDEKYTLSPLFLGEMMDINEQLMELEFEAEKTKLENLKIEIKEKESLLFEEVKALFEMETLNLIENDYLKMKDFYCKKKYLNRILERLNEMM